VVRASGERMAWIFNRLTLVIEAPSKINSKSGFATFNCDGDKQKLANLEPEYQ
jgi:hypothetical protein